MKISIKDIESSDADEIFSITKKVPELWASSEIEVISKGQILYNIKSDNYLTLKAIDKNNKLLGFILCDLNFDYLYVDFLAVNPEFRESGIGTKLLEKAIEKARKMGVYSICCFVNPRFEKTIDFWKKKGFKEGHKFIYFYKDTKGNV